VLGPIGAVQCAPTVLSEERSSLLAAGLVGWNKVPFVVRCCGCGQVDVVEVDSVFGSSGNEWEGEGDQKR